MYQLSFYTIKDSGSVEWFYNRKELDDLWTLTLTVEADDCFNKDGLYLIEYNNSPVVKGALTREELYSLIDDIYFNRMEV